MITEERSTGKETAALAKRCKKFAPLLIVFLLAIVVAVILGMQLRNARNAQRSLSQELVLQKETIEKLREAKNSSATTGPIVDAKPVITNSVVTDRLSTVNNLITAEYLYTNAGQYVNNKQTTIVNVDIGIPFTKKTFLVAYDGRVAAGVDLSKAGIDVDESAKTITITLPKSTITYHEIFEDSLVVVDEKDGLFNKITISDYTEFAEAQKAKMEKKAIERGILKNADEEAKTIVTTVLSSLPGAEEYELVIR